LHLQNETESGGAGLSLFQATKLSLQRRRPAAGEERQQLGMTVGPERQQLGPTAWAEQQQPGPTAGAERQQLGSTAGEEKQQPGPTGDKLGRNQYQASSGPILKFKTYAPLKKYVNIGRIF
jgi:hypothetical protein